MDRDELRRLAEAATPGEIERAAVCYLDAAVAVQSAMEWAHESGPRFAERYEGGAKRAEILADLEDVKIDPLGYHYGRETTPERMGRVKVPCGMHGWPWAPDDWDPASTVADNLRAARALIDLALKAAGAGVPAGDTGDQP